MRGAIVWVCIICIAILPLWGCADKESWQGYYNVEKERTRLMIEAQKDASINARNARATEMAAFSQAMSAAAATETPADDAAIALAWGFRLGQPEVSSIPKIQPVEAPDSTKDIWQGVTPALGLLAPFLYPLAFGWNTSGSTYTATDNAKIAFNSENSGSLNTSGGNMTSTNTDSRVQVEDDCIDCGEGDSGYTIQGEAGIDPVPGEEECAINPDGLACEGCSCSSLAAGECVCAVPF